MEKLWTKFYDYISNVELWSEIGKRSLTILIILLVAYFLTKSNKKIIDKIMSAKEESVLRAKRVTTLAKLVNNIANYVIYFVAILLVLGEFNLNLAPLLAGAGVVGLAIGFGAQSLVKDIISGFFIILEDQFSVGDYIRIGTQEGYVEEIGLRITKVKSWTGEVHIFQNGNIKNLTNFSMHNSVAVVDVNVAYGEDIPKVEELLTEFIKTLPDKVEEMVKEPEVLGVQNLGPSEVVIRITAEVTPVNHWKTARFMRKEIKEFLNQKGIEIAFPRIVLDGKGN